MKQDKPPFAFDGLAENFDRRAGLPPPAVGAIAQAILELAGQGPGLLLDLGAGTGEIGLHLAAAGLDDYLGMDLSLPMLQKAQDRFRRAGVAGRLLQADANERWPLRDRSAKLVFLSRAAHLLSSRHLVDELVRTAHYAGGCLALGRVRRSEASLRNDLRREMWRLLAAGGEEGRRGAESQRHLVNDLALMGGVALPSQVVARWKVAEIPSEALKAWREKPGLAGIALPEDIKHRILDRLEGYARERYGDLDSGRTTEESYELAAVRLPPQ